jgi:hypothetical protein
VDGEQNLHAFCGAVEFIANFTEPSEFEEAVGGRLDLATADYRTRRESDATGQNIVRKAI